MSKMPCCTPADPTFVIRLNNVELACVYGGDSTLIDPCSSPTSRRPSGRNVIAVGKSNPVARTSFWKELVLVTFTETCADTATFPAASRARAVRVCGPLIVVRVSHWKLYGA